VVEHKRFLTSDLEHLAAVRGRIIVSEIRGKTRGIPLKITRRAGSIKNAESVVVDKKQPIKREFSDKVRQTDNQKKLKRTGKKESRVDMDLSCTAVE